MRLQKLSLLKILARFITLCTVFLSICSFTQPALQAFADETEREEYTVYFVLFGVGGKTLEQTGPSGTVIEFPELQKVEGFEFLYWTDVYGRMAPTTIPEKDIALYANWEILQYFVTIIDENGESSQEPFDAYCADSMRWVLNTYFLPENTAEYSYSWNAPLPDVFPLQDVTYKIVKTLNIYTISFDCPSAIPPITFTAKTMKDIQLPPVPQKEHYTGAWDKNLSDVVLESTTITAIYTPVEYTITFENAEGVADVSFNIETKDSIIFPPVPERKGFRGEWDKTVDDLQLENTTVTAVYTKLDFEEEEEQKPKNTGCNAISGMAIIFFLPLLLLLKKRNYHF